MSYHFDEIKGLENQARLLTEKLNRLREEHALETNPAIKFQIEHNIARTEEERRTVEEKNYQLYNINSPSGQSILKLEIEELLKSVKHLGPLYLVNCDRSEMRDKFWDRYEAFIYQQNHFQFYLIAACNTQMPQSFSERMVYELIEEELDSDDSGIRMSKVGERIKRETLPLGRNLEKSKERFKTYFAERFEFKETQSFDDFLKTGIPKIGYEYVVTVFNIPESQWEAPQLPEYLAWIMECFSATPKEVPFFLFYFSFFIDGMHESISPKQQRLLDEIEKLTRQYDGACLLKPLLPVPARDLHEWLFSLGLEDKSKRDELIGAYVKGLDKQNQERFAKEGVMDMDRIMRFQELIYNQYHRKGNSL